MRGFVVPGAIDLHCHFHPDDLGKGLGTPHNGVPVADVVSEAAASGHAAVVLKSHSFSSAQLAGALDAATPGIRVFGGICTDYITGGLNVLAVESALNQGARIVWLPTIHGRQDVGKANRIGFRGKPIDCLDDDGGLVDEVYEIAALTKLTGAVLATGHISAEEHHAVVKAFASTQQVLVTHAGEELGGPHLNDRVHRARVQGHPGPGRRGHAPGGARPPGRRRGSAPLHAVFRLRLRRRFRAPGTRLHRLPRSPVERRCSGGGHRDDGADEPSPADRPRARLNARRRLLVDAPARVESAANLMMIVRQ
jgi:Family of unknown function (DUF6282)